MKQKSTLLQVSGIIYIVIGALSAIWGLLIFAAYSMFSTYELQEIIDEALGGYSYYYSDMIFGLLTIVAIVLVLIGAFYLITGILGVKNCTKPEKAQSCFVLGIIITVLVGLGAISALLGSTFSLLNLLSVAFAVMYLVGSIQLKKMRTYQMPYQPQANPYQANPYQQNAAPYQQANPYQPQQPANPQAQPYAPATPQPQETTNETIEIIETSEPSSETIEIIETEEKAENPENKE